MQIVDLKGRKVILTTNARSTCWSWSTCARRCRGATCSCRSWSTCARRCRSTTCSSTCWSSSCTRRCWSASRWCSPSCTGLLQRDDNQFTSFNLKPVQLRRHLLLMPLRKWKRRRMQPVASIRIQFLDLLSKNFNWIKTYRSGRRSRSSCHKCVLK